MAQKALLLVSLSIDHTSIFMRFCSTFSNRFPLKLWHVKKKSQEISLLVKKIFGSKFITKCPHAQYGLEFEEKSNF